MPEADYLRLERILRGNVGDRIRNYDAVTVQQRSVEVALILSSTDARAVAIGQLLTRTDRELRRAVTIFRSESYDLGKPGNRPWPISPTYGGLEVSDIANGSLHVLLIAYGQVLDLLTSKPLQALSAAITLGQGFGSIRFWHRRKKDPLEGLSARDLLNIVKEVGGNTDRLMQQDMPNLDIKIPLTIDEPESNTSSQPVLPPVFPPEPPEGVSWRRITYIRNYPDGTQDIIYIDA